VRLDQRVLTVEVDDAAWATHVTFLSSTIISRLYDVARVDIERVDVRVAR
jgi:Dna[CI] antecedent, DciA